MGKYKQWLHHQEVGARLRDEIAAHEAERERVLKLAPTKQTSLPESSNPIIAALLGQVSLTKRAEPAAARSGTNGAGAGVPAAPTEVVARASTPQASAGAAQEAPKITDQLAPQVSKVEAPPQEEKAPARAAAPAPTADTTKSKPLAASARPNTEKQAPPPAPVEKPVAKPVAQADTIDPLLEQLLAQAENAPADPLEALNLLASQGPNLTHGEAPQPITTLPTAPLPEPASAGSSALSALLGEPKPAPEPKKPTSEPASAPVAVGVEAVSSSEITVRAETTGRGEKKRSDTDELVASRPTEGYTEPRLIVPQWLKSMELNQNQEGEQPEGQGEEGDNKQRFSVSLPFENEEDMRLHESVERWWQRWRQQS